MPAPQHPGPPTHSRVQIAATVPREVEAALRDISRHTRISLSEQVSRALLLFLKELPRSIEDEEVFEPRLHNLELEEEAVLAAAKLKIEEARRVIRRVEGWRKAKAKQQKETSKTATP